MEGWLGGGVRQGEAWYEACEAALGPVRSRHDRRSDGPPRLAGSAASAASKRRSNARPILNLGIGHGSCPYVSVRHRPLLDRALVEGFLAGRVVRRVHDVDNL